MGYVKIAFDHAFRQIKKPQINFDEAMRDILSIGGDTDTNACIVGAMIGAYVWYHDLRSDWKDKVETFNSTDRGIPRPSFLNQRKVKEQVTNIFCNAPSSLDIEDFS